MHTPQPFRRVLIEFRRSSFRLARALMLGFV
jgi:hypothetical protein